MQAAVLTIGDELLNGSTVDTNSAFIGKELANLGIQLLEKSTIADTKEAITLHLDRLLPKVGLIILTGGLGPTADDITKTTLTGYFNTRLVRNEYVLGHIADRFATRGLVMTDRNREQALVPETADVLQNDMGTAPGMWFTHNDTSVISLPGVPYEMQHLMVERVLPRIRKEFDLPVIIHHHIMTSGIGESWLADKIRDIESDLPPHISLAYLPSPGIVKLRLTGRGEDRARMENEIRFQSNRLTERLGNHVYGYDGISLQEAVGKRLLSLKATLSLAESCTGGNIGSLITEIPGSSSYFMGSVISYDNRIKEQLLGIDPDILNSYGAVSEETVNAMLQGVSALMQTDYAIAVSGVAGPGGGTEEKPVGTVYIGVSGKGTTRIKRYNFTHDRLINIRYSSIYALHELRTLLDSHLEIQGDSTTFTSGN